MAEIRVVVGVFFSYRVWNLCAWVKDAVKEEETQINSFHPEAPSVGGLGLLFFEGCLVR